MTIKQISSTTIKISVSVSELSEYGIDFDSLNNSDENTKAVIYQILEKIQKTINIDFSHENIFIEAFSASDGGCVLYVSIIEGTNTIKPTGKVLPKSVISLDFKRAHELFLFCTQLMNKSKFIPFETSLYTSDDTYKLILETTLKFEPKLIHLAREYSDALTNDSITAAFTKEYSPCIIEKKAAESITKLSSAGL